MKNLFRATRLAFQYPAMFAATIVCSLLVAVLWGGNIGAVYPIIEVTLRGQSMQQWVDQQIVDAQTKSDDIQQTIADLRRQLPDASPNQSATLQTEIAAAQSRYDAEQQALSRARMIQPYIHRYLPGDPFETVCLIVLLVVAATIVKDFLGVANAMMTARLVERVTLNLRMRFHEHVMRMDQQSFQLRGTGGMLATFNQGIVGMTRGLRCILGGAIREPLKMVACMIGAAIISWRLLLVTFILAPVAVFLVRYLANRIRRTATKELEDTVGINRAVFESFNGLQTIQAYTMEDAEREKFHLACVGRMRKSLKIVFYNSLTKPVTEVLGMAAVSMVIVTGAYLLLNQETHMLGVKLCERPLSLASLFVFFGLLVGMTDPARKLSEVYTGIQVGCAAADRVYQILDAPPTISEPEDPRPLPKPHRQLTFRDVQFHYNEEQPVLRDVNLTVAAGETIAIIGPNGCGKSTLAGLIPRFFDPVGGSVEIDGVDIKTAGLRDLRGRIGIVTQRGDMFDDTVFNNIGYGTPGATPEEVTKAAVQAEAHDFISNELSHGYETRVGQNGQRLSGGQRQRIVLARAILRNPDILILDEATSQIDTRSEQLIQAALQRFIHGRTTIIITHRVSALELAQRIVVMQAGRIVDVGTRQELQTRCPLYQQLVQSHRNENPAGSRKAQLQRSA